MDKNTILGFVLIAVVLIGFSILNKPSDEEIRQNEEKKRREAIEYAQTQEDADSTLASHSTSQDNKKDAVDNFFDVIAETKVDSIATMVADSLIDATEGKLATLENSKMKLTFTTKGGQLLSAQLKEYNDYKGDSLYIFNHDMAMDMLLTNKNNQVLRTSQLSFELIPTKDKESLIMRFAYSPEQYVDFVYLLSEDDYLLKFDINMVGMQSLLLREKADVFELELKSMMRRLETNMQNEQRYSSIYYKYVGDDVKELDAAKGESLEVKEPTKWIAFKNQFFATVLIADEKIELALLDSKVLPEQDQDYLKTCEARLYAPANYGSDANKLHAGFNFYLGPMSYTHLKNYDEEIKDPAAKWSLDELVPLGWSLFRGINKYFVIPLFNLLQSTGLTMGIVILLLTLIVKLMISPLTYKSLMSSAKTRVLKPQVEELSAKYSKPEQAQEKQQAIMALYNRAGANPMSGCIPMLLQMPILFALFQFFPNAIDLRHKSFLWAKDLSTYDAVISLPESIPFLSGHISLFCVLMTITNIVYAKFNMDATNTGQQQMPGMKWMMYLMPLVFFFVLNDFPSGLTYYYFLSLLITILLTIGFRWIVDEDKVLAKLEANKAKPKKKSGFMARLEEAQRVQQQQQKKSKGAGKSKKK